MSVNTTCVGLVIKKCEWLLYRIVKRLGFCTSTYSTSTQKIFICHPDPVVYEDPKSAKILVLGDLVPEIMPKNRFPTIFGPYLGFFQNPVKSDWL